MGIVIVTRFVDAGQIERALTLCPPHFRVGVNPSYDLFAAESIPIEWEMDTSGPVADDEQRFAIAAVDTLLNEAGITIRGASNGTVVDPD